MLKRQHRFMQPPNWLKPLVKSPLLECCIYWSTYFITMTQHSSDTKSLIFVVLLFCFFLSSSIYLCNSCHAIPFPFFFIYHFNIFLHSPPHNVRVWKIELIRLPLVILNWLALRNFNFMSFNQSEKMTSCQFHFRECLK